MSNEQVNTVDENTQAAPEPTDIASAFRLYNQSNKPAAQEPVASGEDQEGAGADNGGTEEPTVVASGEGTDINAGIPAIEDGGDTTGNLGGSPAVIEPVDYSPAKQDILKNIQDNAINQVRNEMQQQGIELWTMEDIYQKDENTGRVTFRNPDDPNKPFENRGEAQAWINSINQDINNHFRREVNKKQQELVNQALPTLQMIDFAPTYQSMSETEQGIFDELVTPYAINDSNGNVIGFNVNLTSVANTAKQLAKRFNAQQPQQQQQAPQEQPKQNQDSGPALDIKTGNGVSPDEDEPKTIGEALKRVDAMNRKKKEGK